MNQIIHLLATNNNIIVSVNDWAGNTSLCLTVGLIGYKNAKKRSVNANQYLTNKINQTIKEKRLLTTDVTVKNRRNGKEMILSMINHHSMPNKCHNITSTIHNGCRPAKKRHI